MPEQEQQTPARFKEVLVRILRDPRDRASIIVKIAEGRSMPPTEAVKIEMQPKYRSLIPAYDWASSDVRHLASRTISEGKVPAQVWSDAIGAALLKTSQLDREGGVVTTQVGDASIAAMFAAGAPATVLIGPMVFRLTPVEMRDATKLNQVLRDRAVKLAAVEAENVKSQGLAEANMMINQATRHRDKTLREIAAAQADLKWVIPEALEEIAVRRNQQSAEFPMCAAIHIEFKPTGFVASNGENVYEWPANDAPAVHVTAWLPFHPTKGTYYLNEMRLSQTDVQLPHLSHDRGCVTPEGLPKKLKTADDVKEIEAILIRSFRIVNLSSLLVHYSQWGPEIKAFAPDELQSRLQTSTLFAERPRATQVAPVVRSARVEASETFNLDTLPR